MKKPEFQKKGLFSYKNLMSKSVSTLYRLRKEERERIGSFQWYLYPSNFPDAIEYCIKLKRLK